MEEKKKGKGLKIVLAIFIILFLLTAGALGYGYTKYQKLKNDNNNLNTKYENANKDLDKANSDLNSTKDKLSVSDKNYITISDSGDGKAKYNLYELKEGFSVIGFEGELYTIQSFTGHEFNCISDLVYENNAKFNSDNIYKCETYDEEDSDSQIYKTSIKEKDVYKVVHAHYPFATDPSYVMFFILKDGSVKTQGIADFGSKNLKKLNENKIKNITRYYCSSGFKDTCKGPLKLDVVLQDGSEKTIKLD